MDNLLEIMRVMRKPPMGKLVVIVGDQQYTLLSEVKNPKSRQRLLAAIGELVSFAGGYEVLENAGLAPPSQLFGSQRPVNGDEELTPAQAKFLESLKEESIIEDNPASHSRLRSIVQRRTPASAASPPSEAAAEPQSIAGQIDAILQELLAHDERLSGRVIRLESADRGGLQIVVDNQTYQRPGQIPDKQVQEIIKTALKQWEAR